MNFIYKIFIAIALTELLIFLTIATIVIANALSEDLLGKNLAELFKSKKKA